MPRVQPATAKIRDRREARDSLRALLSGGDRRSVAQSTRVKHPQKFVQGWALDSLPAFAAGHSELIPVVERTLHDFERDAPWIA